MALLNIKNRAEFNLLQRLVLRYQHDVITLTQHAASHGDSHYIHPDAKAIDGLLTELRETDAALRE